MVLLLLHALLAPLVLALAAALWLAGRLSRWRHSWLAAPAAAGAYWALAIGPGRALAGFGAGPAHALHFLAGAGGRPGPLRPGGLAPVVLRFMPGQLPVALVLAAGEVALVNWLAGRRRAAGQPAPPSRPGLLAVTRREAAVRSIRAGGIVTRDGGCLGVDPVTGAKTGLAWADAEGGALFTGSAEPALAGLCTTLAVAAIRRRKPVIVADLAGAPVAGPLAAACAVAGAPLRVFGEAGRGYYDPVREAGPARVAALLAAMLGMPAGDTEPGLASVLTVLQEQPGDPRVPVLDKIGSLLLRPGGAGRSPQPALRGGPAALAERLRLLRCSAPGRWVAPVPVSGGIRISIAETVRDRAVALFGLGCRGAPRAGTEAARMVARLVLADLAAVTADLAAAGAWADGLVWVHGCEQAGEDALAGLIGQGRDGGVAVVASTASAAAAARLAPHAGVLGLLGPLAALPAWFLETASAATVTPGLPANPQTEPWNRRETAVAAASPRTAISGRPGLRAAELALLVTGPVPRFTRCLTVAAQHGT
jgi:hypothetical protein